MIKKYFVMATAALAMVGCSNEDDILNNDTANELVSIASVAVDGQATRAINSENKLVDASLLVFIDDADEKYKANGEVWQHTSAEGWKFYKSPVSKDIAQAYWKGGTVTWRAASFDGNVASFHPEVNSQFALASTFATESTLDIYDMLWGIGTSTTKDFDITLQHAFSKVTVNVKRGTAFEGDVNLVLVNNSYRIFDNKVKTANTLAEVAMPVASSEKKNISLCKLSTTASGYEGSYSGILVPQSYDASDEDNKFKITVTSTTGDYTYKSATPVTLEAGKAYTINLQVAQDNVLVGSITAASWTTVDAGTLETE